MLLDTTSYVWCSEISATYLFLRKRQQIQGTQWHHWIEKHFSLTKALFLAIGYTFPVAMNRWLHNAPINVVCDIHIHYRQYWKTLPTTWKNYFVTVKIQQVSMCVNGSIFFPQGGFQWHTSVSYAFSCQKLFYQTAICN